MDKKRGLVIFSFILVSLFLLSMNFISAEVTSCTVRQNSCSTGETIVMRMSATTNAHGSLPGSSSYSTLVCCEGTQGEIISLV